MNQEQLPTPSLLDRVERPQPRPLSFPWLTFLLAAVVCIIFIITITQLSHCPWPAVCGPILEDDLVQARLNTALPPIQGNVIAEQNFRPRWNGLAEIELTAVRYGESSGNDSYLLLQLLDDQDMLIAEQRFSAQTTEHNQILTFRFPAQPTSAGRRYTLRLTGSDQSQFSVWGYNLDVYQTGQLALSQTTSAVQDLRFITRYHLLWPDIFHSLSQTILQEGALLLLALLFLPLPGILILLVARPLHWDAVAWWGVALALSIATWPLLWQWLTLVGGRWSGWLLWVFLVVGYGGVLVYWYIARRDVPAERLYRMPPPASILIIFLLLLSVAVRFLAVRDLSFPPWVDSSRHALITAVMVESGQTPHDYEPYLPIGRFNYHYGFHTLSAGLSLMTGWPLPRLLLVLGQLLNGLIPLTLYAAAWLVTRRRGPALLAAFLVALPFFFPAYYATWGRMTQLAAVLILPILLALTWLLTHPVTRSPCHLVTLSPCHPLTQRPLWPLVALLAAGLFLLHFRVFLFYLPFAALVGLFALARRRPLPLLFAAGLSLLLILPRLLELLQTATPAQALQHSIANYNEFPMGYVTVGWERYFIAVTAVALLLVLIMAVIGNRLSVIGYRSADGRRPTAVFPLLLASWVALLFLLLAGRRLGLPETSLVNINSLVITLFVPQALFLAAVAGEMWYWLSGRAFLGDHRWLLHVVGIPAGVVIALLALYGGRQQVNILNDTTILAYHDDLPALEWAADNLPSDSLIAVNSWQWLGDTWAGSDGGAWLTPLTRLQTTTPPVDYVYDPDLLQFVADFNEGAKAIPSWSTPEAAAWLREQGVTHVFVGAKGGFFDPAALSANPQMEMIYHQNGVFIFTVLAVTTDFDYNNSKGTERHGYSFSRTNSPSLH
jgi:hypothetical protein